MSSNDHSAALGVLDGMYNAFNKVAVQPIQPGYPADGPGITTGKTVRNPAGAGGGVAPAPIAGTKETPAVTEPPIKQPGGAPVNPASGFKGQPKVESKIAPTAAPTVAPTAAPTATPAPTSVWSNMASRLAGWAANPTNSTAASLGAGISSPKATPATPAVSGVAAGIKGKQAPSTAVQKTPAKGDKPYVNTWGFSDPARAKEFDERMSRREQYVINMRDRMTRQNNAALFHNSRLF